MAARFVLSTMHKPLFDCAQERMLQMKNSLISFNKHIRKIVTIQSGTSKIEFHNVYQPKLPDVVILAMASDTDMSGLYQANPFHFQNFWRTYHCIQANGEQIPRLAYQPNFDNRKYIRSYFRVLEALGFDIFPNCSDLTPEKWSTGYNIYMNKDECCL